MKCQVGDNRHNLGPMWRAAGVYDALYNSDGQTAGEVLAVLQRGLSDMRRHPSKYQTLTPSNGWGEYDTALQFLEGVVTACDTNPDAEIKVSK